MSVFHVSHLLYHSSEEVLLGEAFEFDGSRPVSCFSPKSEPFFAVLDFGEKKKSK